MSIESMALVLHHSRAHGTDKLILLGIANHAGDGGAWPTVETLARYANTSERSVQRSLNSLVKLGELAVHRQAGGTSDLHHWQRPNRYDVLVSCPVTCDHTAQHRPRALPQATHTSPGDTDVTRGVTHTSPGGVTHTSPKPSTQPHTSSLGTSPQNASGDVDGPSCDVCSLTMRECLRRPLSGHDYTPRQVDQHARIERIRDEFAS